MRAPFAVVATALLVCVALPASLAPAFAGMGPCKPDQHEGLICGEGVDAARVIENTTSPDRKLAFAWRSPGGDPTDEPDSNDDIELLIVRLSDGAILGKSTTGYWHTGERRVNRLREEAVWSPDSRLAIHAFQTRFETERLELFALGPGDGLATMVDLQKIIQPAVQARLSKDDGTTFSVLGEKTVSISNAGALRLIVMMWRPKEGPEKYFDVALSVTRGKGGLKTGALTIRKTKEPR